MDIKPEKKGTLFDEKAKESNSACLEIERQHIVDEKLAGNSSNEDKKKRLDQEVVNANGETGMRSQLHKAKSSPAEVVHPGPVGYDKLQDAVDNPTPQLENPASQFLGTNGDKYILVMVGLPARGKTYIARRLRQYLTFFQNTPCELFNVGQYRRKKFGAKCTHEFFDHSKEANNLQRHECADDAMNDLIKYFTGQKDHHIEKDGKKNNLLHSDLPRSKSTADSKKMAGSHRVEEQNDLNVKYINDTKSRVAIYDATNTTIERRAWLLEKLAPVIESGRQVIFIETIIDDLSSEENRNLIEKNIWQAKQQMPDYEGMDEEEARKDFQKRIEHYKEVYEPINFNGLCEKNLTYIKIIDGGRQLTMNNIRGFLPGKIVQFLMNLNMTAHPIYLSRHGESEYNVGGKIGGDSSLSPEGNKYAKELAKYVHEKILHLNPDGSFKDSRKKFAPHARLFTSSLQRTQETARFITHNRCDDGWVIMRKKVWRALDEIYAGVFDGMTYEEIKEKAPDEFEMRSKDKLGYRYPRGESYLDVIQRLDSVIHEIERLRDPLLIIAHQGILRIIYSYFMGFKLEDAPFVSIPLNTVIKLIPGTYFCNEERVKLIHKNSMAKGADEPPSH